jgi:hypothetical protein
VIAKDPLRIAESVKECILSVILWLSTLLDRAKRPISRVRLRFVILGLVGSIGVTEAPAEVAETLRVEARIAQGSYLVGQGFELRVSVNRRRAGMEDRNQVEIDQQDLDWLDRG